MNPTQFLEMRERQAKARIRGSGNRLVDEVDGRTDVRGQIREHPMWALAAGALVGGLVGRVVVPVPGVDSVKSALTSSIRIAGLTYLRRSFLSDGSTPPPEA